MLIIFLSILRFYYYLTNNKKAVKREVKSNIFDTCYYLLLYAFHQGQKAAEATQDICMIYGEGVIGKSTAKKMICKVQKWQFRH